MNVFIGTSVASSARALEAATETAADMVDASMALRPVVAASSVADAYALGGVCLRENAEHGAAAIDMMAAITKPNFIVPDGRRSLACIRAVRGNVEAMSNVQVQCRSVDLPMAPRPPLGRGR